MDMKRAQYFQTIKNGIYNGLKEILQQDVKEKTQANLEKIEEYYNKIIRKINQLIC